MPDQLAHQLAVGAADLGQHGEDPSPLRGQGAQHLLPQVVRDLAATGGGDQLGQRRPPADPVEELGRHPAARRRTGPARARRTQGRPPGAADRTRSPAAATSGTAAAGARRAPDDRCRAGRRCREATSRSPAEPAGSSWTSSTTSATSAGGQPPDGVGDQPSGRHRVGGDVDRRVDPEPGQQVLDEDRGGAVVARAAQPGVPALAGKPVLGHRLGQQGALAEAGPGHDRDHPVPEPLLEDLQQPWSQHHRPAGGRRADRQLLRAHTTNARWVSTRRSIGFLPTYGRTSPVAARRPGAPPTVRRRPAAPAGRACGPVVVDAPAPLTRRDQ